MSQRQRRIQRSWQPASRSLGCARDDKVENCRTASGAAPFPRDFERRALPLAPEAGTFRLTLSTPMRALLFLTLAFSFAACGGGGPVEPSADQAALFAETVDLEIVVPAEKNAMAYALAEISAPAGARVRLVMDNSMTTSRAMIHNVVVLKSAGAIDRVGKAAAGVESNIPDDPAILAHTPLAGPGERQAVIFTMPPAGRYPFICTYPGHFQFMQGVLISTASEAGTPEAGTPEASGEGE